MQKIVCMLLATMVTTSLVAETVEPVAIPIKTVEPELRSGLVGKTTRFSRIVSRKGEEIRQCVVTRADPEGLVFEHSGGVIRISLFDLPKWVQEEYDFDEEAALAYYQATLERQRAIRLNALKEREAGAAMEREASREKELRSKAQTSWIPVEAKVLKKVEGAYLVRAKKITWKSTRVKSRLGVWGEGPPERTLVPLCDEPVFLVPLLDGDFSKRIGNTWKGYIEPEPTKIVTIQVEEDEENYFEGYQAVAARSAK